MVVFVSSVWCVLCGVYICMCVCVSSVYICCVYVCVHICRCTVWGGEGVEAKET